MSERKGDDAVRVPIEIKTEDLSELQQLIQQLTEAEEASRTARASGAALPSKGSAGAQSFAGQAKRSGRDAAAGEGPGGIFGGEKGMQATPQTFRDRSGRQAMKRENQFSALQDQVNQMQEEQMEATVSMMDQLIGMGSAYLPFVGGSKFVSWGQHKLMSKLKQRAAAGVTPQGGFAGAAAQAGLMGVGATGGKAGMLMSKISMIAGRMPVIGTVIAAVIGGIMAGKQLTDWLQSPGGFWDIRYKREIYKEMDPFLSRREKQEINIGLRTVRVTSIPAVRGRNQVFSTLEAVKKGIPIYDGEFEAFSKGLYI